LGEKLSAEDEEEILAEFENLEAQVWLILYITTVSWDLLYACYTAFYILCMFKSLNFFMLWNHLAPIQGLIWGFVKFRTCLVGVRRGENLPL
jgi:hypothetical protein